MRGNAVDMGFLLLDEMSAQRRLAL
jgi:hypothetical protein